MLGFVMYCTNILSVGEFDSSISFSTYIYTHTPHTHTCMDMCRKMLKPSLLGSCKWPQKVAKQINICQQTVSVFLHRQRRCRRMFSTVRYLDITDGPILCGGVPLAHAFTTRRIFCTKFSNWYVHPNRGFKNPAAWPICQ